MIDLNTLWFILIGVLFTGFFFLEGFDFGVGMLSLVLGKTDTERRLIIATVGPVWNSNEVWLLTAGGAIFAAFPGWYATLFSGMYLALFLVLAALIIRGISFEFRGRVDNPRWRGFWDGCLFAGSLLPPLLLAVGLSNILKGLPIDASKEFVGNFFTLLSVPTLVAGLATVAVFGYHGSVFLSLKLTGELRTRAAAFGTKAGIAALVLGVLLAILAASSTDAFKNPLAIGFAALALVSTVLSFALHLKGRPGTALICNALAIAGGTGTLFAGLFPRVMVSTIDPAYSLTIYSISSSPYTLKVMTIVTLSLLPIVLGYLAWTYWVFRSRITVKDLEY